MRIIIVLTDSVALPRKDIEGIVRWDDTYIYKLRRRLLNYEIINLSIGGGSIEDIRRQVKYYKLLKPECVILHCGIVDAAPRAFGRIEMELFRNLRILRLTKPFVSFLRRYRSHHYVSPGSFKNKLLEIRRDFDTAHFITIGIVPSTPEYELKLPNITRSIEVYNQILQKNSDHIALEDFPKDGIIDDHHHINVLGQDYIYQKLIDRLKNCGID